MAADWIGITSAHLNSKCGEEGGNTLADALDGDDYWMHDAWESHWFILDLGESYTITKLRGRSLRTGYDPVWVEVFVSDDPEDFGDAVATGIVTWQDTDEWVEIVSTDKIGRYVWVNVAGTEHDEDWIKWGGVPAFTIFDVYGEAIAVAEDVGVIFGANF